MSAWKVCDAPGCERPGRTPNSVWCHMHYGRMRNHGVLEFPSPPPCSVDGCDRSAKSRGMCGMHAERVRNYGDPYHVKFIKSDPQRRFWSKVEKTDTCWLWTGTLTHDGYGLFRIASHGGGAHRFAYRWIIGPIPDGLHLDHLCRVRNCVKPDHLEPVTVAENNRRAAQSARA